MLKLFRFGVYVFAVIGLAVVAMMVLGYLMAGNHRAVCMSYEVMQVPSPDTSREVAVENNTCGASGELQTVAFLSARNSEVREIIFQGLSAKPDAGSYSPLSINLTWNSEDSLEIAYPRGSMINSKN